MSHEIHRVKAFSLTGPHTLQILFEDGVERTIDFSPVLRGEMFGPLRETSLFAQVQLDTEVGTLVWPNGADFDPETLHDWPDVEESLVKLASTWSMSHDERQPAG